jgi:hypothetical protein
LGKLLILIGLVIVGAGLLVSAGFPLGRLPGDFVIRRDNFTLYVPLGTSILVSVVLTIAFALLRR